MEAMSEFLGFRNLNHFVYFLLSFPCFIYIVFTTIKRRLWPNALAGFFGFGFTCSMAIYIVLVKNAQTEVFSTDCIWYNGALALICLGGGIGSFVSRKAKGK